MSTYWRYNTLDTSRLTFIPDKIPHFKFPKLASQGQLGHAVFTRLGGVSPAPFDSLNASFQVGDLLANVEKNLCKIKDATKTGRLVHMHQVHGDHIVTFHKDTDLAPKTVHKTDALITNTHLGALMVKQADCQGVIIFDPKLIVLAIVHCGWRGNVANVLGQAVKRMRQEFGCSTSGLLAAIGPSLGPCCAQFIHHETIFPKAFKHFEVNKDHFDLWELSVNQLIGAGLRLEHIEVAGICTKCRTDLFYSYRGEGETGRFGTVAWIKE